jgi:hypothetical protein
VCDKERVTVVYVNGILSPGKPQTESDLGEVAKKIKGTSPGAFKNLNFLPAYNPSRFAGIGDGLKAVAQTYFVNSTLADTDLKTIALQLASDVTTEKVLLVGHSQGSFYVNNLYKFMVHNGANPASIGVYHIASPASVVEGRGSYLTSGTDMVINTVRDLQAQGGARTALPSNIDLFVPSNEIANNPWAGHGLVGVYLKEAPGDVVSGIVAAAERLEPYPASKPPIFSCVPSPLTPLSYWRTKTTLDLANRFFTPLINLAAGGIGAVVNVASTVYAQFQTSSAQNAFGSYVATLDATVPAEEEVTQFIEPSVLLAPVLSVTPVPIQSAPQVKVRVAVEQASFPPSDVFIPTPAALVPPTPSTQPSATSTVASVPSNPGKLSSLAFGSGAGGGGSSGSTPDPATVTPEEVSVVVPTITPPPIIPILCTLPQTHDTSTNTCVLVVPICTTLETLDTTTNTCLPKPIPPVVCTTPETRNPATNVCVVPPQTGPTLLPPVFTEDTVLTYALSPYTSDPQRDPKMTIKPGVTVTVEPGVTIAMYPGARFLVEGTLRMQGTSTYPIRTTSICDTTVTPALITPPCSPTALPWVGITITPTGTLAAAHTTFIYGGWLPNGPYASDWPFATINNSGTLTLTETTISTSHSEGVIHSGTSFTSTNLALDTATTGLDIRTGGYDITNTHIANTTFSAVTLGSLIGKITNTTGTNNSQNGITFSSPEISLNQTAHLYPNAISYFTYYDLSVLGTLVVHKNAFVQNAQNTYIVGATGRITTPQDELGAPPVFTSVWNNAQTNEPRGTIVGTAPVIPKVGDWKGFVVQEGGALDATFEKKYNKF